MRPLSIYEAQGSANIQGRGKKRAGADLPSLALADCKGLNFVQHFACCQSRRSTLLGCFTVCNLFLSLLGRIGGRERGWNRSGGYLIVASIVDGVTLQSVHCVGGTHPLRVLHQRLHNHELVSTRLLR